MFIITTTQYFLLLFIPLSIINKLVLTNLCTIISTNNNSLCWIELRFAIPTVFALFTILNYKNNVK